MHTPNSNVQSAKVWRIFMIFSASFCLVNIQSLFNLGSLLDDFIRSRLLADVTFAHSISGLLGICTSRFAFKSFSTVTRLYLCITTIMTCFALMILLILTLGRPNLQGLAYLVGVCLIGYFGTALQSLLTGFASACGSISVLLNVLGTSLSRLMSHVMGLFLAFLIYAFKLKPSRFQVNFELIMYCLFSSAFSVGLLLLTRKFVYRFEFYLTSFDYSKDTIRIFLDFSESPLNSKKQSESLLMSSIKISARAQDSDKKSYNNDELILSVKDIITQIWDIGIGVFIQSFFSLEMACKVIPSILSKLNDTDLDFFKVHFILFDLGNCLGNLLFSRWNTHDPRLLNLLNAVQGVLLWPIVICIVYNPPNAVTNWIFQACTILAIGIFHGHLTQNYFCMAIYKFHHSVNRDLAGFLTVFMFMLGIIGESLVILIVKTK